jgi:hypothetical protein
MAVSGTTNFNLSLDEIVEEALLQIGGEAILGDEPRQARRTIDLLLREWQTQGYSLWKTGLGTFTPYAVSTATVNGNVTNSTNVVVDNNSGLIYSDMVVTGVGTSATANVNSEQTGTQIAIDGASGTILVNMVVTGTGILGTTGVLPYVTAINSDQTLVTLSSTQTLADNVPLTFKTAITGTTGVSPTVSTVTDQNTLVLSSNQTLMDGTSLTFRSNKTTLVSNAIDVLIATVRTDENDIEMERLTMEEYEKIPAKYTTGKPIQYAIKHERTGPTMYYWPIPNDNYAIRYWYFGYTDDNNNPSNQSDVPTFMLPALVSGLAYKMALKRPGVPDTRIAMLKAEYDQVFANAMLADRERAGFILRPAFRV